MKPQTADLFDTSDAFNLTSELQLAPPSLGKPETAAAGLFANSDTLSFAPTKLDKFNTAKK